MCDSRWQLLGADATAVYERHLVPAMFAPWAPVLVDLTAVAPGERVLDVACGTGIVARAAAERVGPRGRIVGLDINAAMLAQARAAAPAGVAIEWLEASALALPLPDASFDVVLCQHGLQQFPDRPAALREMRRVLAPDGRLGVCVWSRIEGSPGMAALARALERHVGPEAASNRRRPFALGDAAELRDLLVATGWRAVEVRTLVRTAHFPSAEALVAWQSAATPLSTVGAPADDVLRAIERDVRVALAAYRQPDGLAVPMEAHVALAQA